MIAGTPGASLPLLPPGPDGVQDYPDATVQTFNTPPEAFDDARLRLPGRSPRHIAGFRRWGTASAPARMTKIAA